MIPFDARTDKNDVRVKFSLQNNFLLAYFIRNAYVIFEDEKETEVKDKAKCLKGRSKNCCRQYLRAL